MNRFWIFTCSRRPSRELKDKVTYIFHLGTNEFLLRSEQTKKQRTSEYLFILIFLVTEFWSLLLAFQFNKRFSLQGTVLGTHMKEKYMLNYADAKQRQTCCAALISLENNSSILTRSSRWSFPPLPCVMSGSGTEESRKGQVPGRRWFRKTCQPGKGCHLLSKGRESTQTLPETAWCYLATPERMRKKENQHNVLGISRTQKIQSNHKGRESGLKSGTRVQAKKSPRKAKNSLQLENARQVHSYELI